MYKYICQPSKNKEIKIYKKNQVPPTIDVRQPACYNASVIWWEDTIQNGAFGVG